MTSYTPLARLSTNEALIALLVAAIETNEHASPGEAARAERVVHEMARLRRLSARLEERTRLLLRASSTAAAMSSAE